MRAPVALALTLATFAAPAALAATSVPEAPLKAKAQAYYPGYVKDLEHLTNIDSGTGDLEGSKAIADWLDTRLTALGAKTERVQSPKGTHLIARFKGTGTKRLLLMAHTDTVFVKGDAAKRPFRVDAQNRAYGPGVGDDKATCLQVLYAMKLLKDFDFNGYGEVTLYFDAEEETGSETGEAIIERLAKQSDVCLVMDTARPNWGIVAKRKGFAQYVLTVSGRSGHAGNAAHHSASATMQLGQMLAALYQLASPVPQDPESLTPEALKKRNVADHGQYIPPNTINVGVVSTPNVKFNVIPDQATAKLDVRCFDYAELQRIDKAIHAMAAKPVVPGTRVKVEGGIIIGPQEKTKQVEALIATYKAIAKQTYDATVVEWQAGGISDGNVAAQFVPTIDALGIEEYDEHTDREWVDLNTVVPRTVVLVKYLEALSK
jgi:glutamate carboxypeptidase